MKYFDKYSSNSVGGSGNQFFFKMEKGEVRTGRIFYKISVGGEFEYSLLFTNIVDSTYADGSESYKNLICPEWTIHKASVARVGRDFIPTDFTDDGVADRINSTSLEFTPLTFNGSYEKTVNPAEFFCSDWMAMKFDKGDYLCLEITFSGEIIPCHEESLLPIFAKSENGWKYCVKMPIASMVGCDREVKARVGFIGDSITQGIGTKKNSYAHWNSLLSEMLGEEYAYWNLGIGYGRADDMATLSAWAYKASQNDILFICYGVNDVLQGFTAEETKKNLTKIVRYFKDQGKKIILQTLPPFDYWGELIEKWQSVNDYIKNELAGQVDTVFDCVPVLQKSVDEPYMAKFGGHPNEEGCKLWADRLFEAIKGSEII